MSALTDRVIDLDFDLAPAPQPVPAFPHEPLSDPAAAKMNPKKLARAVALFRAQQASGRFPGGQLAVRRHGRLVVDEAVGMARGFRAWEGEPAAPVRPDTRFCVFSAGKPLVALCIALLEERGQLDVNAPIAEVFPEFGVRGKAAITPLDVLTHRGGILMPDFCRRPEEWGDWSRVVQAVIETRPSLPRGTLAYHPFEYGWVLSEVVRRVSGRTVPQMVADELAGPMGLPSLRFGARKSELRGLARSYWIGGKKTYIAGIELSEPFEAINNSEAFLTAFIPGAGLVTDAATLAAFYECLVAGGVTQGGRRLFAPGTIRRYTERQFFGWDRSNRVPLAVGSGFLLGTRMPSAYGWLNSHECFGHAGAFCANAFADWRTGLSIAVVTNGNAGHTDVMGRLIPLSSALRAACE